MWVACRFIGCINFSLVILWHLTRFTSIVSAVKKFCIKLTYKIRSLITNLINNGEINLKFWQKVRVIFIILYNFVYILILLVLVFWLSTEVIYIDQCLCHCKEWGRKNEVEVRTWYEQYRQKCDRWKWVKDRNKKKIDSWGTVYANRYKYRKKCPSCPTVRNECCNNRLTSLSPSIECMYFINVIHIGISKCEMDDFT